ncbi:dihydrofolate reductase [Blochmannia endosymbiont of Camponotus sp.]|uniref:dihydrofolate reductase n=1 Tax=Blochmannia endosymbiont of Camponotus sp. TaxID=700220 RepID=UPI002023D140|nr:dihydrofolate reductase [Blochmannia endosymbiont of Camponotus sp.]URJ30235.1 dihydrofolate reductase [Blochmannia endosymbiont of Camponotus sp.]URJ31418.1 dihydrofolate reductase [Blochmannia endosymbiont of Camponotus sp.]
MIISLIVALTTNHVIGKQNVIPWCFPIDIKWFKYHTLHKPIIMGRKTFESIGKKPLLNRLNIVLSRNAINNCNDVFMVNNPGCALSLVKDTHEVMVIGGSTIYNIFLPYAQRLYLTYVNSIIDIDGDAWFPDYDIKEWKSVFNSFYKVNDDFFYCLNFKILERL